MKRRHSQHEEVLVAGQQAEREREMIIAVVSGERSPPFYPSVHLSSL
jgi:hypothetical protein